MNTLQQLETEIADLKSFMYTKENGNDLYFSSPQYNRDMLKLQALETEVLVLRGKLAPTAISFDGEDPAKRKLLEYLEKTKGSWYANCHKTLDTATLTKICHDI